MFVGELSVGCIADDSQTGSRGTAVQHTPPMHVAPMTNARLLPPRRDSGCVCRPQRTPCRKVLSGAAASIARALWAAAGKTGGLGRRCVPFPD